MIRIMILVAMSLFSFVHADIVPYDVYALMKNLGQRPSANEAAAILLAAGYVIQAPEREAIKTSVLAALKAQLSSCTVTPPLTEKEKQDLIDELVTAVMQGNFDKVKAAIDKGADINGQGSFKAQTSGNTATTAAVRYNARDKSKKILDYLLKNPAFNPNVQNSLGNTPLMSAVIASDSNIVDILLSTPYCINLNLDIINQEELTALTLAKALQEENPSTKLATIIAKLENPPACKK